MKGKRIAVVLAVALIVGITGCSIEPWVPVYERGLLAEPIMQFNRDPLSARYRQHVNETREGARGGGLSGGVGCGCN